MPDLVQIEHTPLGLEHPYRQEPTERSPRQPLAGQPVSLGLATAPAGAAEKVWAHWSAGARQGQAEGTRTADENSRTCWQVALPAFAALEPVTYQLFASQGGQVLQSPAYCFSPAAWVETGPISGLDLRPGQVELHFASASGGLETSFVVRCSAPDRLRLGWHAGPPPAAPAEGGVEYRVIRRDPAGLVLETSALRLTFTFAPFSLAIRRLEGELLFTQNGLPAWLVGEGGRPLKLRQEFVCQAGDGFYGFGERFNGLNQGGRRLDVCVFEQYKSQGDLTYIPVPYCFSPRGWGLYLDTARRVEYDLAAASPERWSFEAALGSPAGLEAELFFGPPLALVHTFAGLTGLPELPPAWAFGPWMSSNEWYNQAEVLRQVELTRQHRIPASVLVIEAWSDEATFYIWNGARYNLKPGGQAFNYTDFIFDPGGLWPDPKGMTAALHREGIHLVLWQIPVMKKMEYVDPALVPPAPDPEQLFTGPAGPANTLRVAQRDLDETYMLEQGYHLKYASGEPYRVRPFWFHDSLLMDFSNPAGAEWWMNKRAYLLEEVGVDGFKTDGGEHLWGSEVRFHDGRGGDEGMNLYPNQYVGAYYRYSRARRPGGALTFSRAGFTGAQAFPCHWAGDENSTWPAFRASLSAGLNAGLSGIPFWGWDIGGFSGELPSAELYLRAAAMAAFCPVMQYHSEYNQRQGPGRDRTPWNMAEQTGRPEVIEIYRKYARLRQRLLPYIQAEAQNCAASGEPLMRPLFLDWPEDPTAWQIEDQYCFGRSLLVAPVLEDGCRQRRLYLPAGEWLDVWEGKRLSGPAWITCPVELDRIPVYQRLDRPGPQAEIWQEREDPHA